MNENIFKKNLKTIMCEDYPDFIDSIMSEEFDNDLGQLIVDAIGYGFSNEIHISIFILNAWLLGLNFDKNHEIILNKLSSKHLTSQQKIQWLENYIDITLNPALFSIRR